MWVVLVVGHAALILGVLYVSRVLRRMDQRDRVLRDFYKFQYDFENPPKDNPELDAAVKRLDKRMREEGLI